MHVPTVVHVRMFSIAQSNAQTRWQQLQRLNVQIPLNVLKFSFCYVSFCLNKKKHRPEAIIICLSSLSLTY